MNKLSFLAFRLGRKYRHIKNRGKPPIKAWWWRSKDPRLGINFGDEISPHIIRSIFGRDIIRVSKEECELIAAGSILQLFQNTESQKIKVWGSGFIEDGGPNTNKSLEFHAVRGPLTRGRIANKKVTLGDPGLLASLVFSASPKKTHKVGVVPHYVDANHGVLKKIKSNPDYRIINPLQNPEKVAVEITACDLIFSSSLHGIIFAESFSIPAYWMPMSDKVVGGDYKFRDYYLSTGRDVQKVDVSVLGDKEKTERLRESAQKIKNLGRIQARLIRSFPYR